MRKFPKSVLRARIIKRAVMVGDSSIDASNGGDWDALMSEVYGSKVYETICDGCDRYFEYSTTLTTAGLSYLAEPADILSLVDTVERVVDSAGHLRRLVQIQPQERARWAGRTGHAQAYEFVDDRLYLYPTPPSGDTYIIRYIPQSPDLTVFADSDLIDVHSVAGEAALIWGTALIGMAVDGRNVQLATAMRDENVASLLKWAINRQQQMPKRTYVEDCENEYGASGDRSWWYGQ